MNRKLKTPRINLCDISGDDKYIRLYYNTISVYRGINVLEYKDKYTEVHHIIPVSVGGKDDESNLIRVPYGIHILLHLILLKAYPGIPELIKACNCMLCIGDGDLSDIKDKYSLLKSSVKAREEFIKLRSKEMSGKNNPQYGKYPSEYTRELLSKSKSGGKNHRSRKVKDPEGNIYETVSDLVKQSSLANSTVYRLLKKPGSGYEYLDNKVVKSKYTPSKSPIVRKKPSAETIEKMIATKKKTYGSSNWSVKVKGPDGTVYNTIVDAAIAAGVSKKKMDWWVNHNLHGYIRLTPKHKRIDSK